MKNLQHDTEHEELRKVLRFFDIEDTPRRALILKIILSLSDTEFTFTKVAALTRKEKPSASSSSIVEALTLFKIRGLIREVKTHDPSSSASKRGRPTIKLTFSPIAPQKNESVKK